jgi:hypothetical protein
MSQISTAIHRGQALGAVEDVLKTYKSGIVVKILEIFANEVVEDLVEVCRDVLFHEILDMRVHQVFSVLSVLESVVVGSVASIPVHRQGVATSLVVLPLLSTALLVVIFEIPVDVWVPSQLLLECGQVLAFVESHKVVGLVVDTLERKPILGLWDLLIEVVDDGLVKIVGVETPAVYEVSAVEDLAERARDSLPSDGVILHVLVVDQGVASIPVHFHWVATSLVIRPLLAIALSV